MSDTKLAYFSAPPEQWTILGYYQFRRQQRDFRNLFRQENNLLQKSLHAIVRNSENSFSDRQVKRAGEILNTLKTQLSNPGVAAFWREIDPQQIEITKTTPEKRPMAANKLGPNEERYTSVLRASPGIKPLQRSKAAPAEDESENDSEASEVPRRTPISLPRSRAAPSTSIATKDPKTPKPMDEENEVAVNVTPTNSFNKIVEENSKLSETQKSHITWLLQSFNPVPVEFYRFLNRKTKNAAVNAYVSTLSQILEVSDEMPEEKRVLFDEIQQKWKDGVFNNDWTIYMAERSALSSVNTSISVQRDFNSEVLSHSTRKRKYDPSTPNKPVIRVDMKGLYPQVSFEKKTRFAASESDGDESTGNNETGSLLNPFEVPEGTETGSGQNQVATWRKWLEYILEVPIEDVRIKILALPHSNKNKFEATMLRYIGKVLMDFVNKVIDVPGNVLFIDDVERDWIVSKVSPLFVYLEATFINQVRFHWIEHDIEPTHERLVRDGNTTNKDRLKADMVGVRLCDNRQIVFLEMSGAPTDFLQPHTITDACKTIQERVDAVNSLLLNFLDYDVRYAGKIRSLTVQGIRDRLTLRSNFLRGKEDYVDEEITSAVFPLSWEFRFQFLEIFELIEYIMLSVIEYPNVIKELRKHRTDSPEFSIRHCLSN